MTIAREWELITEQEADFLFSSMPAQRTTSVGSKGVNFFFNGDPVSGDLHWCVFFDRVNYCFYKAIRSTVLSTDELVEDFTRATRNSI